MSPNLCLDICVVRGQEHISIVVRAQRGFFIMRITSCPLLRTRSYMVFRKETGRYSVFQLQLCSPRKVLHFLYYGV